ncbi:MAG: hypothetical protein BJ554DRAFT_2792, partial [Olpidium bornovanus]
MPGRCITTRGRRTSRRDLSDMRDVSVRQRNRLLQSDKQREKAEQARSKLDPPRQSESSGRPICDICVLKYSLGHDFRQLFKDGIKPMWEDKANEAGGRLT